MKAVASNGFTCKQNHKYSRLDYVLVSDPLAALITGTNRMDDFAAKGHWPIILSLCPAMAQESVLEVMGQYQKIPAKLPINFCLIKGERQEEHICIMLITTHRLSDPVSRDDTHGALHPNITERADSLSSSLGT